ncbi:MAG: OmpA family protein [Muribaculum sp.]|nr:OmpA family protein [Muribaculum sp.]
MKKTNFNSADSDQKLIEDHVYLEIEDKGATAAEVAAAAADKKAAAAAVMMDTPEIDEPVKKKKWGGWWAAALFALLAVGCCIYLATRDSKTSQDRTAQTTTITKHAPFTALKGQVSKAAGAVAQAGRAVGGTIDNSVNSVKDGVSRTAAAVKGYIDGVEVYGKYPKASDDLINQEAADGRQVDYLYYFANNASAVPDNAVLNDIAEAAKNTGADITITAYASPTGSAAYNEALCEKRAENIENYLVAHGVSADRIKIVSGGQTGQFGSDAYNRRADILVNYGA